MKARLDGARSDLGWWEVALGGLQGPFHPKPFCDSMGLLTPNIRASCLSLGLPSGSPVGAEEFNTEIRMRAKHLVKVSLIGNLELGENEPPFSLSISTMKAFGFFFLLYFVN